MFTSSGDYSVLGIAVGRRSWMRVWQALLAYLTDSTLGLINGRSVETPVRSRPTGLAKGYSSSSPGLDRRGAGGGPETSDEKVRRPPGRSAPGGGRAGGTLWRSVGSW